MVSNMDVFLKNPFLLQTFYPITSSLSKYRNNVGESADMRAYGFQLCVQVGQCRFYLHEYKTKRRQLISPCVTIGSTEVCGEPTTEGVFFLKKEDKLIRECLRSGSQ